MSAVSNSLTGSELTAAGVDIFEWAGSLATEERVFSDVSWSVVQRLVEVAYQAHTETSVLNQVATALGVPKLTSPKVSAWPAAVAKTEGEIREALGKAAHKGSWYKNTTYGELVGESLGPESRAVPTTHLAQVLARVETWLYA